MSASTTVRRRPLASGVVPGNCASPMPLNTAAAVQATETATLPASAPASQKTEPSPQSVAAVPIAAQIQHRRPRVPRVLLNASVATMAATAAAQTANALAITGDKKGALAHHRRQFAGTEAVAAK